MDLIDQINQTPNAETLEDLRQQLFKMLRDVVSDLDNDLISADSFESFTFPWEIALNSLRYQEATLLKRLPSTDVPTHQP